MGSCLRRLVIFSTSVIVIGISGALAKAPLVDQAFDQWVAKQTQMAEERMRRNISASGTATGSVIASPSRKDPNYYFHWIRDSALVMNSVQDLHHKSLGQKRVQYFQLLNDFALFSRQNQLTKTSAGLGDPRFNVDGSADYEPWGRPQYDGPALRALTLSRLAQDLLRVGNSSYVTTNLYRPELPATTVIKTDLEFIAHNWRRKSIDPWEEIMGQHFFVRGTQLAALTEGAELATQMNDTGAAGFYRAQATMLEAELAKHWSEQRGWYLTTLESEAGPDHRKPSELDVSVVLAALAANASSGVLWLLDPRMLSTATAIENVFARIYAINRQGGAGNAIGRYEEDYYYGGNPWFLTTAAYAELHYRVAIALSRLTSYKVTPRSREFFASTLPQSEQGRVESGTDIAADAALRARLVASLKEKGDGFLRRIRLHSNSDGSFTEQFHRDTGTQISAVDLTWSYANFIRAAHFRELVPTR